MKTRLKIQFASDLHLEFADNSRYLKENPLIPVGDILILAGDISYLNHPTLDTHPFWDWASRNYEQVIMAVGNHELYNFYDLAKMPKGVAYSLRDNINYYYNSVIRIGNTDFIISTLWSEISMERASITKSRVSDFRRILYDGDNLTWQQFNSEYKKCLNFIKESIEKSDAEYIIVVTHHVPSYLLSSPDFEGSLINGAFVSELEDFIKTSRIDYWIYGHSHRNIDRIIGNTSCLSNQLGYLSHNEHLDFDPQKYIEI